MRALFQARFDLHLIPVLVLIVMLELGLEVLLRQLVGRVLICRVPNRYRCIARNVVGLELTGGTSAQEFLLLHRAREW